MTQTIALIDDDRNILTSLSIALEKEGFKVQTYLDGESALIGLTRTPPDLAIVDIKMPKMDGEELLKKLRKKSSLPVIFLTSKDEEVDELLGLKLGADDFVKKSGGFSIKVLVERIRVQLRKKNISVDDSKNIITHGKLKLDPSQLECEWDGKQLPDKLTTTEFLIVQELAKRPGIIKERAQSRITGEGQSAGLKITGDDWARGNRVTGTEGASARKRNPTRPGMTSAMPVMDIKRNDEMKEPDFLITGSSGNTREGQLVTFSGGARG